MTLEQDWERVKTAYLKAKETCPAGSDMFIYASIEQLRKLDNKGIDFAFRRLMASNKYKHRIRLHGGPLPPRYPLRVTHRKPFTGTLEYRYFLIQISELLNPSIRSDSFRSKEVD